MQAGHAHGPGGRNRPSKGRGVNKSSGQQMFMFMFMRHVHEAVFMKPMCMKPLWPHDGGQTF